MGIPDFKRISRQSDATLYIVFAAVYRADYNVTIHFRIGKYQVSSGIVVQIVNGTLLLTRQTVHIYGIRIHPLPFVVGERIKVRLLIVGGYGISRREIEDYDIVPFYFTQTRNTFVVPLGPLYVRFSIYQWQGVLSQRHGQWCIGHAWTVA